jgi:outer membrane lipoprotein SlyB
MNASSAPQSPALPASPAKRHAALIGGGLGVFALGALATALVLKSPHPADPAVAEAVVAPVVAPAPAPITTTEQAPATSPAPAHVVAARPAKKNPGGAVAQPGTTSPGVAEPTETQHAAATPLDTKPAVLVCSTCGIVEGVTPVTKKGEGTGLGAVAGGVLGGVVGHQVGGGSGKKALTVLGAIGGGLAGHEIEKRERSTTVYQLRIRMADGSTRSITQAQSLPVGQHVHVDGQQITPVSADADAPGARAVDTSSRS